jgi:hypothetical protein
MWRAPGWDGQGLLLVSRDGQEEPTQKEAAQTLSFGSLDTPCRFVRGFFYLSKQKRQWEPRSEPHSQRSLRAKGERHLP